METLAVNLQPFFATDEEFLALCAQNPEIRFERKSTGVVTMMSSAGSITGGRNASITGRAALAMVDFKRQVRCGLRLVDWVYAPERGHSFARCVVDFS